MLLITKKKSQAEIPGEPPFLFSKNPDMTSYIPPKKGFHHGFRLGTFFVINNMKNFQKNFVPALLQFVRPGAYFFSSVTGLKRNTLYFAIFFMNLTYFGPKKKKSRWFHDCDPLPSTSSYIIDISH